MDLTDTTKDFHCVWGCVKNTIIGLPIKLTMWGEIFQEFLDAFYDPDNADPHSIVSRATLGCILLCNMTLVLRLSETLRSYETFGAATTLPSAGPVDFCCDLQGVCMSCDWA
ncbi:hypothetical protein NW767_007293 [Fusarium falciforme]|uniref:Uncharacterized protein n=1 Tax=Fusarium falciforme TaxID=195108 RepID=A0A9W8RHA8_9HYPO|nr:hypothetical protein NW755_000865 [Fusarium falciforme]KAJ4200672.1 hypothetical protein NW767_007293 [Fusarium falciforme]KAJ4261972.1 hypothetical protein NW757_000243 [Fusarium falciforme]